MKKVAVTGGLSCGKTTVCQIFQEKGAYIVSADAIVHQLLSPESPIKESLIALFGEEAIVGEQFDRALIAEKVFNNKETLNALEAILHPAVIEEIEKQYIQNRENDSLFVAEIPLLYEIEKAHLFDAVIAVVSHPEIAQRRFEEKTNQSVEEFEKRMSHQLPPSEKSARADFTITNNGSLRELENQVIEIYQYLTQD